jgi:hypothetical protein
MKQSMVFCILLLVVFLISPAQAGEIGEVELIDGSVICGEISSSEGGFYTLTSDTLGTVKIKKSQIRGIRFNPFPKPHANKRDTMPTSPQAQVQVLQQLLMGDPEILRMILSLLNDPDIQRILEDPSIIEAASKGDIEALSSNPEFLKLLNNRTIQEITEKITE